MSHNLISPFFIEAMNTKLEENKDYGDWSEYHPNAGKMEDQLWECNELLMDAVLSNDKAGVCKYAVNLANLAEKAYTEFGFLVPN